MNNIWGSQIHFSVLKKSVYFESQFKGAVNHGGRDLDRQDTLNLNSGSRER